MGGAHAPRESTLVGVTGGKVYRVANGVAALYADTGAQAVTSLAQGAKGVVYAGTLPDAKIFKVTEGKADLLAKLPGTHNIWALVMDRTKTALFAATGPGGDVFRVGLDGTASVYFHADDPSLVSLALADNGDVFAGSSNKGIVYRVAGAGRASVLFDFPGDTSTEVRALAVSHGQLYVSTAPRQRRRPTRFQAGTAATAWTTTARRHTPLGRRKSRVRGNSIVRSSRGGWQSGRACGRGPGTGPAAAPRPRRS